MAREDAMYFPPEDRCTAPGCTFPRGEGQELCFLHHALRERLAAYAHEAWSGWMRYMLGKCKPAMEDEAEESLVIPGGLVQRWSRQMATRYEDLPEQEKQSDRVEADKMLALMRGGE